MAACPAGIALIRVAALTLAAGASPVRVWAGSWLRLSNAGPPPTLGPDTRRILCGPGSDNGGAADRARRAAASIGLDAELRKTD